MCMPNHLPAFPCSLVFSSAQLDLDCRQRKVFADTHPTPSSCSCSCSGSAVLGSYTTLTGLQYGCCGIGLSSCCADCSHLSRSRVCFFNTRVRAKVVVEQHWKPIQVVVMEQGGGGGSCRGGFRDGLGVQERMPVILTLVWNKSLNLTLGSCSASVRSGVGHSCHHLSGRQVATCSARTVPFQEGHPHITRRRFTSVWPRRGVS